MPFLMQLMEAKVPAFYEHNDNILNSLLNIDQSVSVAVLLPYLDESFV